MTRAPQGDDPPGIPYSLRRPHLIPPEELTTHVGVCPHTSVSGLRKDDVGDEPRLLPLNASSLQTPEPGSQDEGSEWLGTYLLTPHYKTLVLAIKPPERTMRSALDLLQERSPDVPGTFFDTVLPLRPQRFAGIGSFVRFSSTVRNTGVGGQAVVVLDLTRVGGHYFVAVLAKELAFQALVEYIIPLTNGEEPPIEIYIGYRTRPWPASALVTLADGDVITVIRQHTPVSTPQKAEDLFADGTKWEYPQTIPRFTYGESLCVLHRDQRFLLPEHHHYGQSSVSYIAEKLRLDPHKTVMCSFAIKDLDVQGHLARSLVAVAEVPSPATTGTPREEAVDLFVLLDPRPFGLKPQFLFLHHNVVHIPTVVALLGLSTSPACKVGVAGGVRRGDHVQVQGNTSLLLFPEQKTADELEEEASSSSSTSGIVSPWEDEAESHTEGHIEDDWGGPFGLTLQGVPTLDPSLPPGHSWNEGISDPEPTGPHPALPYPPEPVGPLGASPEVTTPPPAGGHVARLRIQALVYVPDYVPEIVEIETDLPTTVSAFTELLQDARLASQSSSFPDLFPVSSQSVPAFGVFVAAPQWQCDTAVVLFDCLAYDGTFFAKTVFCRLNRESLLLAAGVPPDAAVHVYLRSSLHHFNMDQRVVMQNGTLVQIARRGIVPGAGHDLADRLTTVDLWDRNAELPGPKTHYNGCFHILSEGRPFPFLVAPGRHATFKQDVAAVLGTVDHRLTIKSAAPRRIVDSYPFGYWATAVVVATEALSRVPCPPARQRETRRILVLDQRRILKGFAWRLVPGSIVPVQDVLDLYTNLCPFCHTVLAHGAPTEEVDGRTAFRIQHGQVLIIEFRRVTGAWDFPASPWSDQTQHVPGTQQGPLPDPPAQTPGAGGAGAAEPSLTDRGRSRTPRQHTLAGHEPAGHMNQFLVDSNKPKHKWSSGYKQHAVLPGNHSLTPDTRQMLIDLTHAGVADIGGYFNKWSVASWEAVCLTGSACLTPVKPHVLGPLPFGELGRWFGSRSGWDCKCLIEPSDGHRDAFEALQDARTATRHLGGEWPFPPYRWPNEEILETDIEDVPSDLSEGRVNETSCSPKQELQGQQYTSLYTAESDPYICEAKFEILSSKPYLHPEGSKHQQPTKCPTKPKT